MFQLILCHRHEYSSLIAKAVQTIPSHKTTLLPTGISKKTNKISEK